MTRTTLLRRTILQFEQILLTDDLTFIIYCLFLDSRFRGNDI